MSDTKRNLSDCCKTCEDNYKSIAWCFDCCGIPFDILENEENFRNILEADEEQEYD